MRHILVLSLCLFILAVVTADFCYRKKKCGTKCSGGWFRRRCKDKYCTEKICCSGYCRDDCGTLCSRWCTVSYTCKKQCSRKTCTGWWIFRRCSNKYYSCNKTCYKKECCPPWQGTHCDKKGGENPPPPPGK